MAISAGIFVNNIIAALGSANLDIDLESETELKVALFTNSVTPDFDASTANAAYGAGVWNANEVSGTGYTAGGLVITSTTLTGSSGVMTFDSADPSWASSTITNARGALIYNNVLSPKSGIVVANLGADYSTSNGTLLIQVAAGGWFNVDLVP
ncbi:hypothetical protein AB0F88_40075 [Streptosporangium sp. NPDC023963]|uniref:hypothetical protein n=1 Tax=Streptosporangium sp. NPDC023963 TaxID=3155608 RepID=UPI003438CB87